MIAWSVPFFECVVYAIWQKRHTQVTVLLDVTQLLGIVLVFRRWNRERRDGNASECGAANLGDANDRLVHGASYVAV